MSQARRGFEYLAHLVTLGLIAALTLGVGAPAGAGGNPAGDIDQWANANAQWQNGNINGNNSLYLEGDVVPFRMHLTNLGGLTSHSVTVEWDTLKDGAHAYDYIAPYNTNYSPDPCSGKPCVGSPVASGAFILWGATSIDSVTISAADADSDRAVVAFTTDGVVTDAVLAWGGHIAAPADHPGEDTAGDISGSPYHMRLVDVDGKGGNQDRSLKADAVLIPGISITKAASVDSAEVGDTVTYTYTVTNTGEIDLTDLTLVDDKLGDLGSSLPADLTLAPGDDVVVQAQHVVGDGDLPGPIVNVADTTGYWERCFNKGATCFSGTVSDSDSASVDLSAIGLTKTVSAENGDIGDIVTYTLTVTNHGSASLFDVSIDDADLGESISVGTLAGGASSAHEVEMTLTAAHVPAFTNTAVATGWTPNEQELSAQDSATVFVGINPSLVVTKVASHEVVGLSDADGDGTLDPVDVTYSYTLTNTGDVTVVDATIEDDLEGFVPLNTTTLGPGDTATGEIVVEVTGAHLPGPIVNTAIGRGVVPGGQTQVDPPSLQLDEGPRLANDVVSGTLVESEPVTETVELASLTVTKTPSVGLAEEGDTVVYDYVVTNTGSIALDVTAVDDKLGAVTLDPSTIASGASASGQASHVVTQADVVAKRIDNVVDATGTWSLFEGEETGDVFDLDDATVFTAAEPALDLTKEADVAEAGLGDTITYTYIVANAGNVALSDVTLEDDVLGSVSLDVTSLAPGASTTATATHTVTAADLPGPIVNVATATATDPDGGELVATAQESVTVFGAASISLDKEANLDPNSDGTKSTTYEPNDADDEVIAYTYVITNTGDVPLTDVVLTDDKLGDIPVTIDTLAPGEFVLVSGVHTLTGEDALAGSVINTAVVTAADPLGNTVEATDDEQVFVIEVLPLQGERQRPVEPAPQVAAEQLPRTGAESNQLGLVALLLMLEGLLLLRLGRRQEA